MPYRIDLPNPPDHALDALVDLGALDVEPVTGGVAALLPDTVSAEYVAHVLGVRDVRVSPAAGRDDESVWTLSPRPVRIRTLSIVPADAPGAPGSLRLVDGAAFGTGLHGAVGCERRERRSEVIACPPMSTASSRVGSLRQRLTSCSMFSTVQRTTCAGGRPSGCARR